MMTRTHTAVVMTAADLARELELLARTTPLEMIYIEDEAGDYLSRLAVEKHTLSDGESEVYNIVLRRINDQEAAAEGLRRCLGAVSLTYDDGRGGGPVTVHADPREPFVGEEVERHTVEAES
jgi:hypothetical protein